MRAWNYQDVLAAHGIACSMSQRGEVLDNAAMELELDLQVRVRRAVRDERDLGVEDLRLHRGVLQSAAASLGHRLH
jgi:hypothetical protein